MSYLALEALGRAGFEADIWALARAIFELRAGFHASLIIKDSVMLSLCSVYLPTANPDTTGRQDGSAPTVYDHQLSSCMLGCVISADILPQDLSSLSTEAKWDLTHRAFREWSPKHQEAIELFSGQDVYAFWPRVGSRPSMNWRESVRAPDDPVRGHPRVWLLGDAVHPMLPSRGMGGNQAMRDAADMLPILVELAEKYKSSAPPGEPEIKDACRRYEQAMIPRAFEWVSKSGGRKPVFIDTARRLDRLILALVAWVALPLARLGYFLFSGIIHFSRMEDAPELAHALGRETRD
ncbi:hypothetical protein B0H14DRAFT_1574287 [Mycena olivaceomarginata]|nr:hypothetical protein B0H14DRAFT_1574287 [Mycena olivaceomarginata]